MAAKSMENDMTAYYDFFYSYNNEPGQVWSLAHTHTLLLKSNSVSNGHKIRGKLQVQD